MRDKEGHASSPGVTVLIPARNEASDIARCLDAVLAQDISPDQVEVIVATADSTDETASIAARLLQGNGFSRFEVLAGGPGNTPANLNTGLAAATGTYLCRVDARSIIPPDYVRRCVEILDERPEVAVTGGAQVAIARDSSATALGIARALNNRYGMGLSKYRSGAASGATDTVYLGAFRTEELREVGGWDERFATNQDFELNRRMGRRGVVWFESGLDVEYLPRRTLKELFQQYRRFGQWKVRYWRITSDRPRPRQMVLLSAGPVAAAVGLLVFRSTPRRLQAVLALLSSSVTLGIFVDHVGTSGPRGGVLARGFAVTSGLAVAAGWSSGVWETLLAPAAWSDSSDGGA